jgi:hypothetical protein
VRRSILLTFAILTACTSDQGGTGGEPDSDLSDTAKPSDAGGDDTASDSVIADAPDTAPPIDVGPVDAGPLPLDPTTWTLAQIEAACTKAAACNYDASIAIGGLGPVRTTTQCINTLLYMRMYPDRSDALVIRQHALDVACAAATTTCDAWAACTNGNIGKVCDAGWKSAYGMCAGTSATACFPSYGGAYDVRDCGSAGLSCALKKDDTSSFCTNGNTCTAARCDGTTLVQCIDGKESPRACPTGWTCGDEAGSLACIAPGASCGAPDTQRCDGDKPVTCVGATSASGTTAHEVAGVTDCATIGGKCDPTAASKTPAIGCLPKATECDPAYTYSETCEGTSIVTCSFGRTMKIDCATYGRTCDRTPYTIGSFSLYAAFCK